MGSVLDQRRFKEVWARAATLTETPQADAAWAAVSSAYAEPGRYYHDAAHVAYCLAEFDKVSNGMERPDLVELALWFHDLVYAMGARDNEQRSADRFAELAKGQFDPAAIEVVHDLIMATVHDGEPGSVDAHYTVDIDLAGMGDTWEHYLADSEALRLERSDQDDATFYVGKRAFLEALLARPSIYHTDEYRQRREAKARENVERYLRDFVDQLLTRA